MKKVVALLLVLMNLFVMCACNTKKDKTDDGDKENNGNGVSSTTSVSGQPGGVNGTTTNTVPQPGTVNGVPVNILSIDEFYGDLARFSSDTGYGYMDKTGKVVIEPIYEEAQEYFEYDLAKVCKDGVYMFIDRTGKVLYKVDYEYISVGDYVNGAFWIETKEETIDGAVHTMAYYKYDGTSVQKAFSFQGENAGENSNFYVPDEAKPDEKYALINGNFIDFYGNKVIFEYYDNLDGTYFIERWYREWVSISFGNSSWSGYIDFDTKRIAICEQQNSEYDYIGNGKYWVEGSRWGVKSGGMGILKDTKVVENQVVGTYIGISDLPDFFNSAIQAVGCGYKDYYTVYSVTISSMVTSNWVYSSAIIDGNGDIVVAPTEKIILGEYYYDNGGVGNNYRCYNFSENGLCKAKDAETGLFGFIDVTGNWVIEPQFHSVTSFSDGENPVAIVDGKAIIDSKGEVICSFGGWKNEIVTALSGSYQYDLGNGVTFTFTFNEDGTYVFKDALDSYNGKYTIKGTKIFFVNEDGDSHFVCAEGEHPFSKDGNKLIIGYKPYNYTYTLIE